MALSFDRLMQLYNNAAMGGISGGDKTETMAMLQRLMQSQYPDQYAASPFAVNAANFRMAENAAGAAPASGNNNSGSGYITDSNVGIKGDSIKPKISKGQTGGGGGADVGDGESGSGASVVPETSGASEGMSESMQAGLEAALPFLEQLGQPDQSQQAAISQMKAMDQMIQDRTNVSAANPMGATNPRTGEYLTATPGYGPTFNEDFSKFVSWLSTLKNAKLFS